MTKKNQQQQLLQQQQQQQQLQLQQQMQQQQQQQQQLDIKNEPDDSDSDSDRERKKNRSRANQNLASRNYRQRKKEYIRDIEEKLAVLALENDQLKKENLNLKKGGGLEIMKPDPAFITMMMEAKQIIIQLDVAIKKNDDRSLIYLLQLFHLSIEKRHSIIEREVEKMVHPYTQAKLAAMGYVPSLENPMISSISGPSSDGWWLKYMQEAQITEEQAQAIKPLRSNHWKADIELRNERERLDRSIKEFYLSKVMVFPTNERLNKSFAANLSITDAPMPQPINNTIADTNAVDISEILEFTRKLEHLKKNFVKQRTLMEDTHAALSAILTPRQEAMLLVRVHYSTRYDFANMEMLKNVWGSVSKDSNFPPPPPQFPPSLLNNNVNQINNNLLTIQNMYSPYSNNNTTSTTSTTTTPSSNNQQQQQLQSPQLINQHNASLNNNTSSPLLTNQNSNNNAQAPPLLAQHNHPIQSNTGYY
uniref:Putative basic-leucine zipper (BZIP) transcription factor n=1 Tax=Acytostelium subglobosum TaxID=361139 RepID=A0A077JC91_ACYSU|nr:putative basic-leucine zipper (bZIP) transcription factor [Acytostelium subglobosum]